MPPTSVRQDEIYNVASISTENRGGRGGRDSSTEARISLSGSLNTPRARGHPRCASWCIAVSPFNVSGACRNSSNGSLGPCSSPSLFSLSLKIMKTHFSTEIRGDTRCVVVSSDVPDEPVPSATVAHERAQVTRYNVSIASIVNRFLAPGDNYPHFGAHL